ncbi:MAG TPA: prolyl oligopeptidase family serine peptidase [Rhodanobacteraceae bacterium]|nr:prolyl oligopeptidase family serine peptidase [Rhodanobacteraceae bacterium]
MRMLVAGLAALLSVAVAPAKADQPAVAQPTLTLEQIMANPDWIGPAVESPYSSTDGKALYYRLKRDGSEIRDLYRVDLESGKTSRLSGGELAGADGPPLFDASHAHAAFVRHGDVFVRRLADGSLRQVTRTPRRESHLQWSADGQALQYRSGTQWFSFSLASGLAMPVATLKTEDAPDADEADALGRLQLHLFKTLRKVKHESDQERAHAKALASADATRAAEPFWLGKDRSIDETALSPDGRWMLVATEADKYARGEKPQITHYVTDSGYPTHEPARPYVGRNDPAPQALLLLDLRKHAQYALSLDALPGIHQDPLKALRAKQQAALRKAGHTAEAEALDAPKTRAVRLSEDIGSPIVWSDDGKAAAIELRSVDNKDRWIVSVDLGNHSLNTQDRLHDEAWISWNFNDFGFLPRSHTLWYLSEASGYSQLYTKPLGGAARQLTSGRFEVSHPEVSADGRWFYLRSNAQAPWAYDVYRVPAAGGTLERVTHYEGMDSFELSPDGSQLAVLHSSAYVPSQLAVVGSGGGTARELTDTRTAAYKAIDWVQPQIVRIPSSHGAGAIYAKFYKPADYDASVAHPAVLFVHGAGYLQDVTAGWSYYFREQMFNNLLLQEGYVVLDMDYRASEGYGRDWRTAIYRQMGHPELEDLLDGKAWLVANQHADPKRVGIYGGSYGGFMTLMALLRAPGEFAAGAALRPVTDWTSYNDVYTSDILNDPQIDPQAYATSSPIEFAAGLADPLLIEHGLIDDNVMASDSIRLYQRFIELHKKDFWLSLYPMERHGFVHADSWHDEYRRIHDLFTRYLTGNAGK